MKLFLEHTLWNPVLRRELLSGLRSPRALWVLLLYLLVPFAVIGCAWPRGDVYYGGSMVAVQVWYSFLVGQLLLVMLLTPVFAAYSVSSEFERKTAEFLWTTLISPRVIIFSKMAAIMLLCSALLIASLPALSMIFFLGGVDVRELVDGFQLMIAAALCATCVAVSYSATLRKGHSSLFYSYVIMGVIAMPLAGAGVAWASVRTRQLELSGGILVFLVLTFMYARAAWAAAAKPVSEEGVRLQDLSKLRAGDYRRELDRLRALLPRPCSPPLPDAVNVVAAQELRMHPLAPYGWVVFAVIAVPSVLAFLVHAQEIHESIAHTNLFVGGVWIALINAVSMTVEQENGVLEDYRLTAIRPRDFYNGKWLASLRMRRMWLLSGTVILVLVNVSETPYTLSIVMEPLLWLVQVEVLGLAAFALSSLCSKMMMAVALSLAISAVTALTADYWSDLGMGLVSREWLYNVQSWPEQLVLWPQRLVLLGCWVVLGVVLWGLGRLGIRYRWSQER